MLKDDVVTNPLVSTGPPPPPPPIADDAVMNSCPSVPCIITLDIAAEDVIKLGKNIDPDTMG